MYTKNKKGQSLIWDEEGTFIEQSWAELKVKIKTTQGGLGIIADDFCEMLQIRSDPFREEHTAVLRKAFSSVTIEAREEDDIKLLAEILYIILIHPWEKKYEAGWFINHLVKSEDKTKLDCERAVRVINELYKLNSTAATILLYQLKFFVEEMKKPYETNYDLLIKTGGLYEELIRKVSEISII